MTLGPSFNHFPQIAAQLVREGQPIIRKAAEDIHALAETFVAVDTGNLKNSIFATHDVAQAPLTAIVGTNVEYAVHQEYGTVHQSGTAFLRPAVERVRGPFIEAWSQMLGKLGR